MTLKYHISPSAITEDFIVKIWEAASDGVGAEVHEETVAAPHAAPVTITVNGLDKVVHIIRLYGADSATLLHEYNAEPTVDTATFYAPIRFKIGDGGANTPLAGTSVYTNPLLVGLTGDDFTVHRNNYGFLHPGVHITVADGFTLSQPGDVFNDDPAGEEFTIQIKPKTLSTVVNDSVVGKWFKDFLDVAADTDYIADHLRKLIRFSGTCSYSFTVDPPIGYAFCFQHFGATGIGTVKFDNAPLLWNGTPKESIDLPTFTEACFVFDGDNWNVVYLSESGAFNAAMAVQPGAIIGVGTVALGNIAAGDNLHTVTHNKAIVGDYLVFFSLMGTAATAGRDNDTQVAFYHHATDKPNKFYMMVGEIASAVQNLTICYLLIKV